VCKNDLKFSTVCEKLSENRRPLGDFFDSHCIISNCVQTVCAMHRQWRILQWCSCCQAGLRLWNEAEWLHSCMQVREQQKIVQDARIKI